MPGARRANRVPRCAFRDGRGRCRRNATVQIQQIPLCAHHAERATDQPVARAALSDWFAEHIMGDPRLGPVVEQLTERISVDDILDRVVRRSSARGRQIREARTNGRPVPPPQPADPLPPWARNMPPRQPPPRPTPPPPDPSVEARKVLHFGPTEQLDRAKIQTRRKKLAAMCHPDAGGDTGAMQVINAAADTLLSKCG